MLMLHHERADLVGLDSQVRVDAAELRVAADALADEHVEPCEHADRAEADDVPGAHEPKAARSRKAKAE